MFCLSESIHCSFAWVSVKSEGTLFPFTAFITTTIKLTVWNSNCVPSWFQVLNENTRTSVLVVTTYKFLSRWVVNSSIEWFREILTVFAISISEHSMWKLVRFESKILFDIIVKWDIFILVPISKELLFVSDQNVLFPLFLF